MAAGSGSSGSSGSEAELMDRKPSFVRLWEVDVTEAGKTWWLKFILISPIQVLRVKCVSLWLLQAFRILGNALAWHAVVPALHWPASSIASLLGNDWGRRQAGRHQWGSIDLGRDSPPRRQPISASRPLG